MSLSQPSFWQWVPRLWFWAPQVVVIMLAGVVARTRSEWLAKTLTVACGALLGISAATAVLTGWYLRDGLGPMGAAFRPSEGLEAWNRLSQLVGVPCAILALEAVLVGVLLVRRAKRPATISTPAGGAVAEQPGT